MNKTSIAMGIMALFGIAFGSPQRGSITGNLGWNFEKDIVGDLPAEWLRSNKPPVVRPVVINDGCLEGLQCLLIPAPDDKPPKNWFFNLNQRLEANAYLNREIRFRAAVRVENRATTAQLWVSVNRVQGSEPYFSYFNNMEADPIKSQKWKYYTIVAPVAADSESISFGVLSNGKGKIWLDDVTFETAKSR